MSKSDGTVVNLMQTQCSNETVETFDFYAAEARKAKIIGAAVILLKPGGGYDIDVIGEAGRQPEYVRGLNKVLDDQLAKIIGSR